MPPSPPPRVAPSSQQVHICPFTPTRGDLPLTAGSRLPLHPLPGQLTEPPLRGTHSPSFTRTPVSHPVLGSSGRLVPLRWIQSLISRAAFLVTLTTCSSTPRSDQKGPLGPRAPWLRLGAHSPPAWPFPLTALPAGSPGAPTTWGRLSALSWGGLHGVRWGLHHTAQQPPPPPDLLTLHGPRVGSGPHCVPGSHLIPALPVGELLCACCTGGTHSHAPPRSTGFWWAGSSKGMGLTWAGTCRAHHPGNSTGCPHCKAPPVHLLVRSDPEPLRAGPELTNSCSWTGQ